MDFGSSGLSWKNARKVFPLATLRMIYVQSGVSALNSLTIPMFGGAEEMHSRVHCVWPKVFLGNTTSRSCILAIACMLTGLVVAGLSDVSFSKAGYPRVAVCVVSTTAYLIFTSYLGESTGLNPLLFYNNIISFPRIFAWFLLATDETETLLDAPQLRSFNIQCFLLVSASFAFLLNLCIFCCTKVNSPMVTTIKGQIKDVATTGLGLPVFGDVVLNAHHLVQ